MKFVIVFAAIAAVALARPTSNIWNLEQISNALQNPNVDPTYVPVLEDALNLIMEALFAGQQVEGVLMPMSLDAVWKPIPGAIASDEPASAQAGTPMVQIIVNVNGKQPEQTIHEIVPPIHVIDGENVVVEPDNAIVPLPEVSPIDVIAINPIVPTPVQIAEENEVEPEVAIMPQPEIQPIDIIAVNPVDSWGPDGFRPAIDADVGPM
ncbi:unnamed protein product, partial [Brenthis ino]